MLRRGSSSPSPPTVAHPRSAAGRFCRPSARRSPNRVHRPRRRPDSPRSAPRRPQSRTLHAQHAGWRRRTARTAPHPTPDHRSATGPTQLRLRAAPRSSSPRRNPHRSTVTATCPRPQRHAPGAPSRGHHGPPPKRRRGSTTGQGRGRPTEQPGPWTPGVLQCVATRARRTWDQDKGARAPRPSTGPAADRSFTFVHHCTTALSPANRLSTCLPNANCNPARNETFGTSRVNGDNCTDAKSS